jgi:hypothetical protein
MSVILRVNSPNKFFYDDIDDACMNNSSILGLLPHGIYTSGLIR